jgi:hypothetical protein
MSDTKRKFTRPRLGGLVDSVVTLGSENTDPSERPVVDCIVWIRSFDPFVQAAPAPFVPGNSSNPTSSSRSELLAVDQNVGPDYRYT